MKTRFESWPYNTGYCWFLGNSSRRLADCTVAGKTVREWIEDRLAREGIGVDDDSPYGVNLEYLPPDEMIGRLPELLSKQASLVDQDGESMAWHGQYGDTPYCIVSPMRGMKLVYPWHLLDFLQKLLAGFESSYDASQVSPLASINGVLRLGRGSVVLPGVVIEGHVIIGEDCRIGPNCYIRGTTSIGNRCVVGQSVEIKSSVIGNDTFISHLTYVGDSIVGDHVNFGAGSACSNYRHDGGLHKVMLAGELYETGRDKLGAMIGNYVKLGCHTVIYPGRIIHAGCTTLPGQIVTANLE